MLIQPIRERRLYSVSRLDGFDIHRELAIHLSFNRSLRSLNREPPKSLFLHLLPPLEHRLPAQVPGKLSLRLIAPRARRPTSVVFLELGSCKPGLVSLAAGQSDHLLVELPLQVFRIE